MNTSSTMIDTRREGGDAMNGPGIKEYPVQTMDFYASCIVLQQLNTVVAFTDGMKTIFLLNLAAFAAFCGIPTCVVSLQLPFSTMKRRFCAMLLNCPINNLPERIEFKDMPALVQVQKDIKFCDLSLMRNDALHATHPTVDSVEASIDDVTRQMPPNSLILVDGMESMADYDRPMLERLISRLGKIAIEKRACVWMTAQGNRQSESREVFALSGIAEASAKAQISSQVMLLGYRIVNQLLSCCRGKHRNGSSDSLEVARLVVRPSLRLEVFETIAPPIHLGQTPGSPPAPIFIGCETDTSPVLENAKPGRAESDADDADVDAATPPLRSYHGVHGWVGIGRAVSASPMFTNRDTKYVFWLLDLYFMAQFEPGTLYAPRTKRPVKLARGQVMTSPRILADRWGVSRKKVETFLATAGREGLISMETEFRTHRARQGAHTAGNPTKEPKERALCTVITLSHYEGNNNEETE